MKMQKIRKMLAFALALLVIQSGIAVPVNAESDIILDTSSAGIAIVDTEPAITAAPVAAAASEAPADPEAALVSEDPVEPETVVVREEGTEGDKPSEREQTEKTETGLVRTYDELKTDEDIEVAENIAEVEVIRTPDIGATPEAAQMPEATATVMATQVPEASATAEVMQTPQITATAEPTQTPAPTVSVPELALTGKQRFVFAGESADFEAVASGGMAPYTISALITLNGTIKYEQIAQNNCGEAVQISYVPEEYGVYEVLVTVTDAAGVQASGIADLPVAVHDKENSGKWSASAKINLTNDWHEDLVAVAQTQVGYRESAIDFIIDENGKQYGYTRYGDWYGSGYGDWNAEFVSFCLNYAHIAAGNYPRAADAASMKKQLVRYGAYEEDVNAYEPVAGDLVFFHQDGESTPERVAIVEKVNGSGIGFIEGDVDGAVRRCNIDRDDHTIVGYASTAMLMERAGILKKSVMDETSAVSEPEANAEPEETVTDTNTAMASKEDGLLCSCSLPSGHEGDCPLMEEPEDYEGTLGEVAVFAVQALDGAEFQWQRKPVGADDDAWEDILDEAVAAGFNTNELSVVITEESAKYLYRCRVSIAVTQAAVQEEREDRNVLAALVDLFSPTALAEEQVYTIYSGEYGISLANAAGEIDISPLESILVTQTRYWKDNVADAINISDSKPVLKGERTNNIEITFGNVASQEDGVTAALNAVRAENSTVTAAQENNVVLNVTGESRLGNINVAGGAKLTLNLNANLTALGTITVSEGAELTVQTNGYNFSAAEISGVGFVQIEGKGNVTVSGDIACGGIIMNDCTVTAANIQSAGELNINGATVSTNNGSGTIAAKRSVTTGSNSTISNAAFFGVNAENGAVSMTLNNPTVLNSIDVVGVPENSNAVLSLTDNGGGRTGVNYIRDYGISFVAEGNILAEPAYPTAYRVKNSSGVDTIIGMHVNGSYQTVEGGRIDLAAYTREKDHYVFMGWTFGELPENPHDFTGEEFKDRVGDVTLTAVLAPKQAAVRIMLNDGSDKVYASFGETIDDAVNFADPIYVDDELLLFDKLPAPFRVGYSFKGYGKSSTDYTNIYGIASIPNYTVKVSDADWNETSNRYEQTLCALWEPLQLTIQLKLSANASAADTEISFDNGSTWAKIAETDTNLAKWNEGVNTLTFNAQASYGESLKEYFTRLGISMPIVRDISTDATAALDFLNWTSTAQQVVQEDHLLIEGENGLLKRIGSATDEEFQKSMMETGLVLSTAWTNRARTLTVKKLDSAWTISVDNVPVTPIDGKVTVPYNHYVTFTRANDATTLAYWQFTYTDRENKIEYIYPEEGLDYTVLDTKVDGTVMDYTFLMPQYDVTATYDVGREWDTAEGDYNIGDVTIGGESVYGFTLTEDNGTVHTYRLPASHTSFNFFSSEATPHQIKVDGGVTLKLREVKLTARAGVADLLGATNAVSSYYFPNAASGRNNGNIVLKNGYKSDKNELKLVLQGENSIYLIETSTMDRTANLGDYKRQLTISGGTLKTSAVVWLGRLSLSDMTLKDAEGYAGALITQACGGPTNFTRCTVDTERAIHSKNGGTNITGSGSTTSNMDFIDCPLVRLNEIHSEQIHFTRCASVQVGRIVCSIYESDFTDCPDVKAGYIGVTKSDVNNSYPNLIQTVISNSTIVVSDEYKPANFCLAPDTLNRSGIWLGRLKLSGGSTVNTPELRIRNNIELAGKSVLNVEGTFAPISSKLYDGTTVNSRFYMDVAGGSTFTMGNLAGGNDFGTADVEDCYITIRDAGTVVTVNSSASLLNRMSISRGATLNVKGDLTVKRDMFVGTRCITGRETAVLEESAATLNVEGNIYHVGNTTIVGDDGWERNMKMEFSEQVEITHKEGAVIGAKESTDRVDVIYPSSLFADSVSVVRDVRVRYTLPQNYQNPASNKDSIRLINDVLQETLTLIAPTQIDTSQPDLNLTDDCWHVKDTDIQVSGWATGKTMLDTNPAAAVSFAGNMLHVLELEPKVTDIAVKFIQDNGAISKVEYWDKNTSAWVEGEIDVTGHMLVPIGTQLRISTADGYGDKVVGRSIFAEDSLLTDYNVLPVTSDANGGIVIDLSGAANATVYVMETIELYLDRSDIRIGSQNGVKGFWLNADDTEFYSYAGNYLITQRDADAYSPYTLKVEENNATGPAVTMTGIKVKAHESVDTAVFTNGGVLKLAGSNLVRNLIAGTGSSFTLNAEEDADTVFAQNDKLGSDYYNLIGTKTSSSVLTKLTLNGGTYRIVDYLGTGPNSTRYFFGSAVDIALNNLTVDVGSAGRSLQNLKFSNASNRVTITGCTMKRLQLTGGHDNWFGNNGMPELVIDSSNVVIYTNQTTAYAYGYGSPFSNIAKVTIRNGSNVSLERNSKDKYKTDALHSAPSQALSVSDGSTLNIRFGARFASVSLDGSSTINVTDPSGVGYPLAAESITTSGTIRAGWVAVGGFTKKLSDSDFVKTYFANAALSEGGTLTVNGGSVTAIGGQMNHWNDESNPITMGGIGGSRGAKIIVNSGEVKAHEIGTLDYAIGLFKFGTLYRMDTALTPATVTVNGGSVEAFYRLGGTGSTVNITGGRVESDVGAIYAGTGSVNITGGVTRVKSISADGGSVTIKNANSGLIVPTYDGNNGTVTAGVQAAEFISAAHLTITDGAVVSTPKAYSDAVGDGSITISLSGKDTKLYTQLFGAQGTLTSKITLDIEKGTVPNGIRYNPITYDLSETVGAEEGQVINDPDNPAYFAYSETGVVQLKAAELPGWNFDGWFTYSDATETVMEELSRTDTGSGTVWEFPASNPNDVKVYAKWSRKIVEFQLYDRSDGTKMEVAPIKVPYEALIVSEAYIMPDNYEKGEYKGVDLLYGNAAGTSLKGRIVNLSMIEAYETGGEPLKAYLDWALANRNVRLYLNRNANGLPQDARFEGYSSEANMRGYLEESAQFNRKFAEISFEGKNGLPVPTADGYTFTGWYSVPEANDESKKIGNDTIFSQSSAVNYYAGWAAKEYTITFDAGEGAVITMDNSEPDTDDTLQKVEGSVVFDEIIRIEWRSKDETNAHGSLPDAWKKGYVFEGWIYSGEDGIIMTDENSIVMKIAGDVTFRAKYREAKVSYNLNGGKWTAGAGSETVRWDEAMPGVTKKTDGSYAIYSDVVGAENDYRNKIIRIGYTFNGWYTNVDDDSTLLMNGPLYNDVKVIAKWSANTYNLRLNTLEGENDTYTWSASSGAAGTRTFSGVTVDKAIAINYGTSDTQWPERTQWKIVYSGETADRALLGFTQEKLVPKKADVIEYAKKVVAKTNAGQVFNPGTKFKLDPAGPDYRNGATIDLYAVYRERSLIFVEYVKYSETEVHSVEVKVVDYTSNDDAVLAPPPANKEIVDRGYVLDSWRVGKADATTIAYTVADFKANREIYKATAEANHEYDIYITSAYRPQMTQSIKLTASAGIYRTNNSHTEESFVLPASFTTDAFAYKVELDGITLVNASEISSNVHDATWGTDKTPDNTFALKMVITDKNGNKQEYDLTQTNGFVNVTGHQLGAGYTVKLVLAHANRITKNAVAGTATVTVVWGGTGGDASQKLTIPVTIATVPPQYNVTFDANLPIDRGPLTATPEDKWYLSDTIRQITQELTYGAELKAPELAVEGMTLEGWMVQNSDTTLDSMQLYDMDQRNAGTLYAKWTPTKYTLKADAETMRLWKVAYSDVYTQDSGSPPVAMNSLNSSAQVAYNGTVTAVVKTVTDTENLYPEFITDEKNPSWSLLEATESGDTRWFRMPTADCSLVFNRVKQIDLSNGSVEINATGYTQNGVSHTWRGDYVVYSSTSTENTLILNGLAQKASIELRGLTSSGQDSIKVNCDAELKVSETVTVQNILTASGKSITVSEKTAGSKLVLTPANGSAGINGKNVSINGVDIQLTLPAGSKESGIGATGSVVISNATLTADVLASTNAGEYGGAVIGGSGCAVKLSNTIVTSKGMESISASTVKGNSIEIADGSDIEFKYPIEAAETLKIDGSKLEATAEKAMLKGSVIMVDSNGTNSTVDVTRSGYFGSMKLYKTSSQVDVSNGRLVEMKNGDLTVNASGYTQGSSTHAYTGKIILLDEFGNGYSGGSGVTVNRDAEILLGSDEVRVKSIGFTDRKLILNGQNHKLSVSGNISGSGKLTLNNIVVAANGTSSKVGCTNGEVVIQNNVVITAGTIGALGTKGVDYTKVTKADENATLTYTGTLVRDWYYVKYVVADGFTNDENNPDVFRTSETGNATPVDPDDTDETVAIAPAESEKIFDYWFIKDSNGNEVRLAGTSQNELNSGFASYAVSNASGVPELTLRMEISFVNLQYDNITLVASDGSDDASIKAKQYEFTISMENTDLSKMLVGEKLYVNSVTGEGLSVVSKSETDSFAADVGSDYAQSHFALTAKLDNGSAVDVFTAGSEIGEVADGSKLVLQLHNFNALIDDNKAGEIELVLSTNADPTVGEGLTHLITFKLQVVRSRSQISVTLPLVIVMQTNIDGGTSMLNESIENNGYVIQNNSSMDIRLQECTEQSASNILQKAAEGDLSSQRDVYRIEMNFAAADMATEATQPEISAGKGYNPIKMVAVSPLSFVTKQTAVQGTEQGLHFSTISYKVGIPANGGTALENTTQ